MKLFIFIFCATALISCTGLSDNKYQESKKTIIAGQVLNKDSEAKKSIRFVIERLGFDQDVSNIELDSTGYFKLTFDSYVPTDVLITYYQHLFVLTHPGDSVYLEFDREKNLFETLRFAGSAAKTNDNAAVFQSMLNSAKIGKDMTKRNRARKEYGPDKFKAYCDSLKIEKLAVLDSFIKDYSPDREVQIWAENHIEEEYCTELTFYPQYHRMSNKLTKEWDVPTDYYDFLTQRLPITNTMLVASYSLSGFINSYQFHYVFRNVWEENSEEYHYEKGSFRAPKEVIDSLKVHGIIKHTQDALLRQLVLTAFFSGNIERNSIELYEKYSQIVNQYITEPFLKEPLERRYNDLVYRIENPTYASNATLKKMENTSIESVMDSILVGNKGKVIYMDSWGTWCGPCLSEFPHSITLMEEFGDDEISYVFLCIDSEEKQWKSTVSKYQLGGQHYFLDRQQSNEFRNVFDVTGIPHYFIFDKDGVLVEKGSHLRPRSVKQQLKELAKAV